MCELKFHASQRNVQGRCGHTLTGVWVEIVATPLFLQIIIVVTPSRVCELKFKYRIYAAKSCSHTLTGVWVEMRDIWKSYTIRQESHPHGCVSWNSFDHIKVLHDHRHTLTGVWVEISHHANAYNTLCHTLTGVWVEISSSKKKKKTEKSHSHGCVSWNISCKEIAHGYDMSHPHGCVSWNTLLWYSTIRHHCHTLTGVWVEIP